MQKLVVSVCLSVLTAVAALASSSSSAADRGGVSAGRDGVSAGSVSASRDGVSARGGGASVSASRDGASARSGGATATASRDGASARAGGASARADDSGHGIGDSDRTGGFANAAGDREYDSLGSWMEDLGRWWSGSELEDHAVTEKSSTNSSSSRQVTKATATSTDGDPAVAEASNRRVTKQAN